MVVVGVAVVVVVVVAVVVGAVAVGVGVVAVAVGVVVGVAVAMTRRILSDFMRGLSVLGLARKYARTVAQIESILRKAL